MGTDIQFDIYIYEEVVYSISQQLHVSLKELKKCISI